MARSGLRGSSAARVMLALLWIAALLAGAAGPAGADPEQRLEEIQRRKQEVSSRLDAAERESAKLLDRIQIVDSNRADAEARVGRLDARIDQFNRRIAVVEADLTRAQIQLAALSEQLDDIEEALAQRVDAYTSHAVAAYKAGPSATLDGLLDAQTFGDLVDRYKYYEAALDADSELVAQIDALRQETAARRDVVEDKRAEIAANKRRLEQDRAAVERIRAVRAEALQRIEDALAEKKSVLARAKAKKSRLSKILDQLERESNQISSLLSGASAGPVPTGGGQLLWPAAGPMTSGYGWRTHPIFGDRRFHAGIDIGAPYGASVIASDGGEVVFVGTMSGYGNVVVVDHGGGLATTYNHLSGFEVGSGQSVGRGQRIGAVGCTGYCTGPHLHFEVRVNGSPVDPMPYLR